MTSGLMAGGAFDVNFMMEQPNRGKRSIGIDLYSRRRSRTALSIGGHRDVFLTSFLPAARQKMKIDVEHIQARNPKIVYVRGSGMGQRGPEPERVGMTRRRTLPVVATP